MNLKKVSGSFCVLKWGKKLKIAIQKSGRLNNDSIKLLKKCGITFGNGLGKLRSIVTNFPVEIFFLRDDDIPNYVEDSVADIGIVGENVLVEKNCEVKTIERLGFGKCRLSLAFAVCDIVSSGSPLFTNGLEEVETLMQSEAILFAGNDLPFDLQTTLDKLLFRLKAGKSAKQNKYILLNAPNNNLDKIIAILPGMRSPSVLPLAESNWSSVHSVINKNDSWDVVENLKNVGAEGILVLSIDQMIQ